MKRSPRISSVDISKGSAGQWPGFTLNVEGYRSFRPEPTFGSVVYRCLLSRSRMLRLSQHHGCLVGIVARATGSDRLGKRSDLKSFTSSPRAVRKRGSSRPSSPLRIYQNKLRRQATAIKKARASWWRTFSENQEANESFLISQSTALSVTPVSPFQPTSPQTVSLQNPASSGRSTG